MKLSARGAVSGGAQVLSFTARLIGGRHPIQSFYLKEFTPVTETYTDNEYTESECYEKEDFFCYSGGC